MKIIVCGGRDYENFEVVESILDKIHKKHVISTLIEGGCRGADSLAAIWANNNGVNRITCHANWQFHGNKAGPIRNKFMLSLNPDGIIAFGGGKGTGNMLHLARSKGFKTHEVDR